MTMYLIEMILVGCLSVQSDSTVRLNLDFETSLANSERVEVWDSTSYNQMLSKNQIDFDNTIINDFSERCSAKGARKMEIGKGVFFGEGLLSDSTSTQFHTMEKVVYRFDVVYDLRYFPDVSIVFDFAQEPTKECLDEVVKEVKRFGEKFHTVFIHELYKENGYFVIPINHNTIDFDNYSDKDFERDVRNFDFLLGNINQNRKISNLRRITFL